MDASLSVFRIVEIFSHCMITLILPNSSRNFITLHPLLVYIEDAGLFEYRSTETYAHSEFIFHKVTFIRRKQGKSWCWATLFVDTGSHFYTRGMPFSRIFPKILGSGPAYFIFMAYPKQKIENQLGNIYKMMLKTDLTFMGNREFCLFEDGRVVKLHHLNRYHRQEGVLNPNPVPTELIKKFTKFTEISCSGENLSTYYSALNKNADLVSATFNKYFWTFGYWMDDIQFEYKYSLDFRKMQHKYFFATKYPDWFSVADDSKGLEDFIAYTILSETLYNLSILESIFVNDKYLYFGSATFRYLPGNHQIILVGRKSCSFISCYGIQHEMSYELYTQPFHRGVWISIFLVILSIIGMTWATNWLFENETEEPTGTQVRTSAVDIVIVSFSILLEISLSTAIDKLNGKLSALFWLWIVSCVVISNMCKDVFTSEVIKPFHRNPSWSHIYDLDELEFKFLLPLKSVPEYEQWYSNGTRGATVLSIEFAGKLHEASVYAGNLTRLSGYRRVSSGMLRGDPAYHNTRFAKKSKRIWQEVHYKWPHDLYTNLSKCSQKFAYVDYTENIVEILPFLNDNDDGIFFLKGADDNFLSYRVGFQVDSTHRKNFVSRRLKGLISSGIYYRWEKYFKKTRPKKLFMYYANWTRPILHELERRDFGEKFNTIWQIWGYCCLICSLALVFEIVKGLSLQSLIKLMLFRLVNSALPT
ncbi:hypothetical protein Fcan01_15466 [Folsomia candida]|uniref:Uncharacterized protein n=1 Tax=Folsomia candida TaxID=158441 RepID=A0A226DY42_FOLCA|nr:hypothetical protein Fcan01_15466 [Folsomia candida]